jgi:hypothetical protein
MSKPHTQSELAKLALEPQQEEKSLDKAAYELPELTDLGYGSRSYLYLEIGNGRLRAVKRGRRTIVLASDLNKWLSQLPNAKISPPKLTRTKGDETPQAAAA